MGALETLQAKFSCQLLFVESGGDNLAANYSRELADYIIYVIDVSVRKLFTQFATLRTMRDPQGGDKIPRKGGPGISQSDLLVINKVWDMLVCTIPSRLIESCRSLQIDIAQYVNASLEVMNRDSKLMRGDGPTIFCSVKEGKGVDDVANLILAAWRTAGSPGNPGAVASEDVEQAWNVARFVYGQRGSFVS
jgi:urease accessory protein